MPKKTYKPEFTDLRSITRDSDRCLTVVYLLDSYGVDRMKWLEFGQAMLSSTHTHLKTTTLSAYMLDATDFEEDSAYALTLPIIGLAFEHLSYHTSIFHGWVAPDAGDDGDGFSEFRVPRPGYNPMEHEDAKTCTRCEKHHIIVPEDFYVPPFDAELYEAVRGHRVEIRIGPNWKSNKEG